MRVRIDSLDDLNKFANGLVGALEDGMVIALEGDLGAGKTKLVSFVGQALKVEEEVQSPTFSLVNIYKGDMVINHLDLYRLESEEEIESFEYEDYFFPRRGVSFIEWPQNASSYLPRNIKYIRIEKIDQDKRSISLDDEKLCEAIRKCGLNENISD